MARSSRRGRRPFERPGGARRDGADVAGAGAPGVWRAGGRTGTGEGTHQWPGRVWWRCLDVAVEWCVFMLLKCLLFDDSMVFWGVLNRRFFFFGGGSSKDTNSYRGMDHKVRIGQWDPPEIVNVGNHNLPSGTVICYSLLLKMVIYRFYSLFSHS